jgi:NaMN:DMB phosphoribosyltransferase
VLQALGVLEIVAMVGAMLTAAERRVSVLVVYTCTLMDHLCGSLDLEAAMTRYCICIIRLKPRTIERFVFET